LVTQPEEKTPLERPRVRREDNITVSFEDILSGGVDKDE
jgi:hypothetical protein